MGWKHAASGRKVLQDRPHAGARANSHLIAVKGDVSGSSIAIQHQRAMSKLGIARRSIAVKELRQRRRRYRCQTFGLVVHPNGGQG